MLWQWRVRLVPYGFAAEYTRQEIGLMHRNLWTLLAGMLGLLPVLGQSLRFEAEDWTTPKDAWQVNEHTDTKWNLWSTDKGAKKKWSGGIVLQSPRVFADRKTGEEGAPVLHTVITGIPKGTYDVDFGRAGRVIGFSLDGKTWHRTTGGLLLRDHKIGEDGRFEMWVDDRFAMENEVSRGSCYYDYLDFWPTGPEVLAKILGSGTKVEGYAKQRREELLWGGLVALRKPDGVYLSWRMSNAPAWGNAFHVYRLQPDGARLKLTEEPLRKTTDFMDRNAPAGEVAYEVENFPNILSGPAHRVTAAAEARKVPYVSIKLQDETTTFQKVGIVDLDGDGRLDYLLKTPNKNIDPAGVYWQKSPDAGGTYVLEAYRHDGTFLWKLDLGRAIERGIWYSPLIAWDLDGDGKAEVAAKIGEGDPRDQDGRVTSGPEWMAVFSGETGKELARVPWPNREGLERYGLVSRNQMAVAYLDGRTPCLLALRGTYGRMKVDAYEFHDGTLRQLWRYDNQKLPRRYWGQGEHMTHCFDADRDGRDEVMLGSVMLDDTGIPLWTTDMGHPDFAYIGDHDVTRPGLEIFYGIESRAQKNGMCMVDARTGEFIWGYDKPTRHVHGKGLCADLDPTVPGREGLAVDCISKRPNVRKGPWLWSAKGDLLWFEGDALPQSYSLQSAYWDADLQREIVRHGRVSDYQGSILTTGIQGSVIMVADVLGDWREELITSVPGELRIYSTTIPANDRRVCLLKDRGYRADMVMNTMGYTAVPTLSYLPEAHWPNLNATLVVNKDGNPECHVVVSAPLNGTIQGQVTAKRGGVRLGSPKISVDPGKRVTGTFALGESNALVGEEATLTVALAGTLSRQGTIPAGTPLPIDAHIRKQQQEKALDMTVTVPVRFASKPVRDGIRVEAETIAKQGGGKVHLRDDKKGVVGKAISHWDDKGHWLEWNVSVPKASTYSLLVRYSSPHPTTRILVIDGRKSALRFPGSGGFGSHPSEWDHAQGAQKLSLSAGQHIIRLENADGKGLNLDYLLLQPVAK
jgi:rhamnogalacturonan endolyase